MGTTAPRDAARAPRDAARASRDENCLPPKCGWYCLVTRRACVRRGIHSVHLASTGVPLVTRVAHDRATPRGNNPLKGVDKQRMVDMGLPPTYDGSRPHLTGGTRA